MAYATYSYYTNTYLGTAIAEADFPRLALRASTWIDRLTFDRAVNDTENTNALSNACCAIAEDIQRNEANGGNDAIQSEAIGQNSVSYAATSSKMLTAGETYQKSAALYLENTGLMFAGFEYGEYSGEYNAD